MLEQMARDYVAKGMEGINQEVADLIAGELWNRMKNDLLEKIVTEELKENLCKRIQMKIDQEFIDHAFEKIKSDLELQVRVDVGDYYEWWVNNSSKK